MPTTSNIPSIIKISVHFGALCSIKMRVSQPFLMPRYLEILRANDFDFNSSGAEDLLGLVGMHSLASFMTVLAQNSMISADLISKWETHRETILALGEEYRVIIFESYMHLVSLNEYLDESFELAYSTMLAHDQGHTGPRIVEEGVRIFPYYGIFSSNREPSAQSVGFFSRATSREISQTPTIRGGSSLAARHLLMRETSPFLFEPWDREYSGHAAVISDGQREPRFSNGARHLSFPDVGANAKKIRELGIPDEDIPLEFICPLSLSIMTKPVRLKKDDPTRTVFERDFIEYWIQKNTAPSHPMTRKIIAASDLEPDHELQAQIDAYIAELTERSVLKLS